jgi:non-specific serine/threonine protein kinase
VTLVGVGGTGKTRLMLHIAGERSGRYPDGAWLIELAPLREPALVDQEVLRALGIQLVPGQPATAAVIDFLRSKDLLLLLDNCEHLIGAAAELAGRLLESCPHCRSSRRAARRWGSPARRPTPCRRSLCPTRGTRLTSRPSRRPRQ